MAATAEPTLQELANKFGDSEDEMDVSRNESEAQGAGDAVDSDSLAARPDQPQVAALEFEGEQWGDEEDAEEEEEDWDSEDEELASAMEWADLRDGKPIYLIKSRFCVAGFSNSTEFLLLYRLNMIITDAL
jgi:hypothetical protein